MKLNGSEFKIYNFDTQKNIVERIAFKLKTTPRFLWFQGFKTEPNFIEDAPPSITVVNVLTDLAENNVDTLTEFEARYSEWFGQSDVFSEEENKEELLKWFIITFLQTNLKSINLSLALLLLENELKEGVGGREFDLDLPEKTWRNKVRMEEEYNLQVKRNAATVLENDRRLKDLEKVSKTKESFTSFVIEKIKIFFEVQNVQTTTLTLFNTTDIENEMDKFKIAIVSAENFFKINNKIDFQELRKMDPDFLIFNACKTNVLSMVLVSETRQKKKRFEFIEVTITLIASSNHVNIELDLSVENSEESRTLLKNFIISSLFKHTDGIIVGDTVESKVKGSYYVLDRYFQKEIFLDMIMNDPNFTSIYVDERFKVSKQQSRLFAYFVTPKTGTVAFSLLNQVVTENEQHPKHRIKVRISSIKEKSTIPFFQDHLNRLLSIYFQNYKKLLKFYNEYVVLTMVNCESDAVDVDIEKKERSKIVKKTGSGTLAQHVPSLFLPLYSRKCAKAPRIVTEDEIPTLKTRGFQTMKYPIKGEGGLNPSVYSCDLHETHPYPGLRINTLSNANTFKYLPCCYVTNQENRRGSPYGNYFKGDILTKDMTDHELYKTPRIIPDKILGILPSAIQKIFTHTNSEYFRYGTKYTPNSFIDAVARATGDVTYDNSAANRFKYIQAIRTKMITNSFIAVSKQETFDLETNTIKQWLNSDLYFDPKRFIKMVEDYFNVSVFLFERNVGTITFVPNPPSLDVEQIGESLQKYGSGGQLSVPIHSGIGPYLLRPLKDNVVFIYIHMGSEIDKVKYPQCETIIKYRALRREKTKGRGQIITLFKKTDKEVNTVQLLYKKLTLTYIDTPRFANDNNLTLTEQFIDLSGKTRMVYASWMNGEIFTIVTEPIHPLLLPFKEDASSNLEAQHTFGVGCIALKEAAAITPLRDNLVDTLITRYDLKYRKTSFEDYLCKSSEYLEGVINGVKIIIYINANSENVRRQESILHTYGNQRKIARILFEFVLHSFHKFRNETAETGLARKLDNFIHEKCIVDNSFKYALLPTVLDEYDGVPVFDAFTKVFMNSEEKIVFNSENLFIRLLYNVRQLVKHKWNKIEKMIQGPILNTYFENVLDFEKSDNAFFIIYGSPQFSLFISDTKQGELLLNTLQPFEGFRFFSSNDIENGKLFYANCFSDIDKAITFQTQNNSSNTPGTIYIFNQFTGYEYYQIKEQNFNGVKIVAFKVDDGTYYLTLNDV